MFLCVWFWSICVLSYSKRWNRSNIKDLLMFYVLTGICLIRMNNICIACNSITYFILVPIVAIYAIAFMSYKLAKRTAKHFNQNRHQPPEPFYPKRESIHNEMNQNMNKKQTEILKLPV